MARLVILCDTDLCDMCLNDSVKDPIYFIFRAVFYSSVQVLDHPEIAPFARRSSIQCLQDCTRSWPLWLSLEFCWEFSFSLSTSYIVKEGTRVHFKIINNLK